MKPGSGWVCETTARFWANSDAARIALVSCLGLAALRNAARPVFLLVSRCGNLKRLLPLSWYRAVFLLAVTISGCSGDASVPGTDHKESDLPKPTVTTTAGNEPVAHAVPTVELQAFPLCRPAFSNIAASSGIGFQFYADRVPDRYFLPEVMGGGAAWCDFDRDGWLDLYLMNGSELQPKHLGRREYRNGLFRSLQGQQFADVSMASGSDDAGYGQGCACGDFDADGFPDLYLTNYGANVLLVNNGDGTLSDTTIAAGVGDERWGTSSVWVDIDGDGLLDLYSANYMDATLRNNQVCLYGEKPGYCGPGRYAGVPDLVYISNGDGTFRESAVELGFNSFAGKGLAVAVTDFDGDFRPEIYVANDMEANMLYTRTGTGPAGGISSGVHYHDIAPGAGCAVSGDGMNEASMGISCADFDHDGLVDIYLTHYYQMKNTLYHNLGGMLFEDDSYRTGIAATSLPFLGFGTVPLDYNGDGFADLFIANGHVLGLAVDPSAMTPQLLLNNGKGSFSDVSKSAGDYFQELSLGRGVAGADYDNDGDLDLAVSHLDRPVALLRNETVTDSGFLGISLERVDRVPPLCARVTAEIGDQSTTQILGTGGSYLSTSDGRLLFAVRDATATVNVEVCWPSGKVDTFDGLSPNSYWRIVEGKQPEVLPR